MANKRPQQTRQQRVGRWGEDAAACYLERSGYTILGRNIRTRYGEIDILARQHPDGELVFVEVKTRTSLNFGFPEEAVDSRKLEHMGLAADAYLESRPELAAAGWRFDVIAIHGAPGGKTEEVRIEHFENISS